MSARDRAWMPSAQSVPAARVRSSSRPSAVVATSSRPPRTACLDELCERPVEHAEILLLAGPVGRGERVLGAAKTVVQDCARELGHTDRPPFAPRGGGLDTGLRHLQSL